MLRTSADWWTEADLALDVRHAAEYRTRAVLRLLERAGVEVMTPGGPHGWITAPHAIAAGVHATGAGVWVGHQVTGGRSAVVVTGGPGALVPVPERTPEVAASALLGAVLGLARACRIETTATGAVRGAVCARCAAWADSVAAAVLVDARPPVRR
jgi:hypothetical protein